MSGRAHGGVSRGKTRRRRQDPIGVRHDIERPCPSTHRRRELVAENVDRCIRPFITGDRDALWGAGVVVVVDGDGHGAVVLRHLDGGNCVTGAVLAIHTDRYALVIGNRVRHYLRDRARR